MTLPYFMLAVASVLLVNGVIVLIAPLPGETPQWAGPYSMRTVCVRIGLVAAAPISVPVRLLSTTRRAALAAIPRPQDATCRTAESVAAQQVRAGE
ncbi:hypothetical protein ACQP2U_42990 (plasmid) [Nocardia sp. CA-084685]|uniref:hypothetical protein n=1 Tax=Nocardia sp. CA-084685 TaxID=3239970 RepID=UPI003D9928C9